MQCKEPQWLCETQFFDIIFYEELKKKIIQSKLKADVDHANHYFLKKHLYTCYDQKDQCDQCESNIT